MFTGIVEEVGTIVDARELENGRAFTIAAERALEGVSLGDSISVDGACHTVTAFTDSDFSIESVATTLGRTIAGSYSAGRAVNLERALALGDRLGGHLVQGHVDGTGRIVAVEPRGEHVLIDFSLPDLVAAVTVLHGSITLNGISLTVNALPRPGVCQVSIIPFTRDHTTIGALETGNEVNLEGDTIGKYVRHLLGAPARAGGQAGSGGVDLRAGWGY